MTTVLEILDKFCYCALLPINGQLTDLTRPRPAPGKQAGLGRMTVSSPAHGTACSMGGALVAGPGQDVDDGLSPGGRWAGAPWHCGRGRRPEPIPCLMVYPQCMPQESGGPGRPAQAWACRGLSKRMRHRELRMTVLSVASRAAIRVVMVNLPVKEPCEPGTRLGFRHDRTWISTMRYKLPTFRP